MPTYFGTQVLFTVTTSRLASTFVSGCSSAGVESGRRKVNCPAKRVGGGGTTHARHSRSVG